LLLAFAGTPAMIVPRPLLERRVRSSLDAGRIPVLLGACGSGRTSLLLRLADASGRARCQYLDMSAIATTPERCVAAVVGACAFKLRTGQMASLPASPRAAFEALLAFFDEASAEGQPATFLLDDVLDVRTFESFPGLRQVQRELVSRLARSPNRFVLASSFTTRMHRLLRDAPARFEVIHVPPLETAEVAALAMLFDGVRPEWAQNAATPVTALVAGRAAYADILLGALAQAGVMSDPLAALASLFAPDGRLTSFCRHCYEFRLHRARGYGALKAILSVLADVEPLNLTDIAQRLHRTPGSTKDYLSWLEDVDLVSVQRKRYSFEDPVLRLYVRLYGGAEPPDDDKLVREIHSYAQIRLPRPPDVAVPVAVAPAPADLHQPGIIEID
jgi:hypothetical protein